MRFSKKQKNVRKGFSIVEVLLAAAVLTVGLAAALGLIASSIRDMAENRDAVIASELAQEGVELIRNVRDNNLVRYYSDCYTNYDPLNHPNCDDANKIKADKVFDRFPSDSSKTCRIDKRWNTVLGTGRGNIGCGSSADYSLSIIDDYYVHGSGDPLLTKFHRKVHIQKNVGDQRTVTSYVWWGNSEPGSDSDPSDCTTASQCAFSQSVLTVWK
jgi:prepilin-type N-terminal cleavage/methylation domain-containing protein